MASTYTHKLFNVLLIACYFLTVFHHTNGQFPRTNGLGGLVDVDVHKNDFGGKHIGVHVPAFYKMDLDKDPSRTGLGINVLEGLVKVRVRKDPYREKNNVFVAVAGVPFWMQ
ncbi:hypothetical protein BLOT_003283 [Blomia tropicalis]|nr:hypothetical protein BLOT_003283 [Blomia tropicalis]